jgi:hypothetical protein
MMSDKQTLDEKHNQHQYYEIRLKGHLDDRWAEWFDGLTITIVDDGDTLVTGPVIDQAALHGLLKKVRDLGMTLVSVNRVQFQETHPYRSKKEKKMNTSATPTKKIDTKTLLSTLWVVVMINMLKADILSLYIPGSRKKWRKPQPAPAPRSLNLCWVARS